MTGLFLFLFFSGKALADSPPRTVVEPDGCPDLCCSYGTWMAKRKVKLYERPDSSHVAATVGEGEEVTAGQSELHVHPRKVKVTMEQLYETTTPRGTTLYLIRRLEDGTWRVWLKGQFLNGIQEIWDPAEDSKISSVWWVRLQTQDGRSGWTKNADAFDGSRQTSCH